MKRILFVDEEALLLEGLENRLRRLRSVWDMHFVSSAEEARARMSEAGFDVVVSEMQVGGSDGLQLLAEVKRQSPQAVRIVLSSSTDEVLVLRAAAVAHQFLAKPCAADELQATIERSLALRQLLASERVARVAARLNALPALPALYQDIHAALGREGASLEDVGRIVARDVALSAKVLQLVNSAFFGLSRPITSAGEAAAYLGLDTLRSLVLGAHVFDHARALAPERLELRWTHSLRVGSYASAISKAEGLGSKTQDEAFLAGMLHEVGLLLLMSEMHEELAEAWKYARRLGLPIVEGERRVIGATHAVVGAYLMGIWGLPDPVVRAIAFHHSPSAAAETALSTLTIVHAATALDCGEGGSAFGETERELDRNHLQVLGLSARFDVWRETCARIRDEVKSPGISSPGR